MHWCLLFVAFPVLLPRVSASSTSFKTVNITGGEQLKEYLCSPTRTIPPYTHLVLNPPGVIKLLVTGRDPCLVENTTNVRISAWQEGNGYQRTEVVVSCDVSLSFFNVTNLTIDSVHFTVPIVLRLWATPEIVKYINGSDQFFYYVANPPWLLLFSHCSNLTLHNVQWDSFSLIGVNLCGWSNINLAIPDKDLPNTPEEHGPTLIYYTDSAIMQPDSECNLNFESNILSGGNFHEIDEDLHNGIERMTTNRPIRDFALCVAQQDFKVNVNVNIHPFLNSEYCGQNCGCSAIIMFINSVTDSHVTFQGHPYEFCSNSPYRPSKPSYRPVQLDVVFYETPSFKGSAVGNRMSPLIIQNTSFAFSRGASKIQRVLQFSRKLSYEVTINNVAWCNNSNLWINLFHGQSFIQNSEKALHLKMTNVSAQYTLGETGSWQQRSTSTLVELINVICTVSGTNYFGKNYGGSVISAVSSNLTITGKLTVTDGYAYQGGGIRLDTNSYLFLKEPLVANFINNSALQGGAIFAPVHENAIDTSTIQILTENIYFKGNLSNIKIRLHFNKTAVETSLYAPNFVFYSEHESPHFLFNTFDWDHEKCQYVFTSLIDSIFEGEDEDKYTSLNNGVCFNVRGKQLNCFYIDNFDHSITQRHNIPTVDVYLGEKSLSLFCGNNRRYWFSFYNHSTLTFSEISCEAKDYDHSLWRTSLVENYLSFDFPYSNMTHIYNLSLKLEIPPLVPFLSVNVQNKCPIGFSVDQTGWNCKCAAVLKEHGFECDVSTMSIISPPNYWVSFSSGENDSQLIFSTLCPPNYCRNVTAGFNNQVNDTSSGTGCIDNRSGKLCGQCSQNYSAVFGSDTCYSHCSHLYLLTLPVYAVAGILLVVVLFAFNLTVATGTINGVIFYANILDLSMSIFSRENIQYDLAPLRIIISLLNLNLGFPMCLYEGMTPTIKAGLQFLFPVYLWGIVLALIVSSRFSVRLSNIISRSSVQVLATLFYLSFSKMIISAIYIFSVSTVFSVAGDGSDGATKVWFYGGTDYGQGSHGFLLFVAAVFMVSFFFYMVLLTFSHCLLSFKIINRVRPFLDAYGGPFKDKWRFWFGLRLWLTALLLSVDGALHGTDSRVMLIAHFALLLAFILLQAHVRPFRNHLVGAVDMFFMLNYLLIVEFYLLSLTSFLEAYIILVSTAVFVMVSILLSLFFYNYIYLKKHTVFLELKIMVSNRLKKYVVIENEREREDSDEDLFNVARNRDVDTY